MPAAAQNARFEASDEPASVKDLGTEITELCSYIYAANYRLLVLIREFDEAQGWAGPGLCSCAHWLNFQCGIGINAARGKVRVAHALKKLPKISERFEKGELSYSKVRAMTRIADSENKDFLLRIAEHGTAYHVEKLVQKYRRAKRLQDVEHANRQYRHRYLEYHYDEDGCLVHEGGYGCERSIAGDILFTAPDGQPLPDHIEACGLDDIPAERFDDYLARQDIDDHACVPEFHAGDTMDWNLAVGALFPSPSHQP